MREAITAALTGLGMGLAVAGCGETPTEGPSHSAGARSAPVDWSGVELELVEDSPYRIAFDPAHRVREGRLDSVTVHEGTDVIASVRVADRELVVAPARDAHGPFVLRAHLSGTPAVSTSDRDGRVEPRTDVAPARLLRATGSGVEPAAGRVRVEALADGRTLGEAGASSEGRWSGFQLAENRRFLVVRAITIAGGDTSFVRRVEVQVEPGADLSLGSLITEAAPPGWTRRDYRRYMCDAGDFDGDRWHGVTMWEPAGMDCRIRRGKYERVLLAEETPLVVDGRPVGSLDESERDFLTEQLRDPGDGVAILGERLPVEVLEPDPPPSVWEPVEIGGVVYARPTRPGTLLVYVDASLGAGASFAWDTDGDGVADTGFVMIGYQPGTDLSHADFTMSHELMRHAGLVGLASRDFLDRTLMSFFVPDAPTDPTVADLHAAEAMRRHPPGVPTDEVFGLVF